MANRSLGTEVTPGSSAGLIDTQIDRMIGRFGLAGKYAGWLGIPAFIIAYLLTSPAGNLLEKANYFLITMKIFATGFLQWVGVESCFFSCAGFIGELQDGTACTNESYFHYAQTIDGYGSLIWGFWLSVVIGLAFFGIGYKWIWKKYAAGDKKIGEKTHISGEELMTFEEIERNQEWWANNDPDKRRNHTPSIPFGGAYVKVEYGIGQTAFNTVRHAIFRQTLEQSKKWGEVVKDGQLYVYKRAYQTTCTENTGTAVFGAAGTGKTSGTVIAMLNYYRDHPEYRVIVYDFGGLLSRYFSKKRGDIIINPLDVRNLNFNPYGLMKTLMDTYKASKVFVPNSGGDKFWIFAPVGLMNDMHKYCIFAGLDNPAGFKMVKNFTPQQGLDTLGKTHLCEDSIRYLSENKLATSLGAVIGAYTQIWDYLSEETEEFDFEQWLDGKVDKEKNGWIWLTNNMDVQDVLAPWHTFVLQHIIAKLISPSEHISMKDAMKRRVAFVIDEANTLSDTAAEPLCLLATNGRKFGSVLTVIVQDVPRFEEKFGETGSKAILGSLSNWALFRAAGDVVTSEHWSKAIGEETFSIMKVSKNDGFGGNGHVWGYTEDVLTEPLLRPADFTTLPTNVCYAKIGEYGVFKAVCLEPEPTAEDLWIEEDKLVHPNDYQPFIQRPDLNLAFIKSKYQQVKMEFDGISAAQDKKEEQKNQTIAQA